MLRLNTTTTQRKVFLMASLITLLFACGKSETKETQRAASDSEVSQETRAEGVVLVFLEQKMYRFRQKK